MAENDGDPGVSGRSTVFGFDPVFGAKVLGEVQAEGLRAASALVERLVHLVDGSHPTVSDDSDAPSTAAPAPDLGAIRPWIELWSDVVDRTSDTLQRLRAADTGSGVQLGIDGSLAPSRPLVIPIDADGRGTGEMWLHNGTPHDHGELVPHCGPLSDVQGNLLACAIHIEPPGVDGLPSRSSRGFILSAATEPASPPGVYRGIVQVDGAEAVWMPIELIVTAQRS